MTMRIAILGCGPAGLVAAYAAEVTGASVHIFSKPRKSELFGAQYLHRPIPGIPSGRPHEISYQLIGSEDDYRRKVYGPSFHGAVSPGSLAPGHLAYDIRHTYDMLWDIYGGAVGAAEIEPAWMKFNVGMFDGVISTIPLPSICANSSHRFESQEIMAMGDAPERGQYLPAASHEIPEGTVICNGNDYPSWYRASRIFGYGTMEWSLSRSVVTPGGATRVRKPLSTSCDCWPGVTRIGRYGKWQKGVLVHEAYQETIKCIANL